MGCRSSAPLDVMDARREDDLFAGGGIDDALRTREAAMEVLTLADLAAFDDRRRRMGRRNRNNHDERMADIAALQQSLSLMETFFENLVGQAGFYMEAMDPNNAQGTGPPPASDAAIASLIQSPLTEKELSLLHNKLCSVCCEALQVKEKVSRLPCGHFYHPQCVEPWLSIHCTCPACRYELPTDDDDFEEGRAERMRLRKLPMPHACARGDHCCDEDSSHSSESRPDVTWDESSTASWGEDFDFWYREQLVAASEAELHDVLTPYEEPSWMVRLIDEDGEDRPTSTLPAAVERRSSREVRDESLDDGEPTPRASNESKNKTHFDDDEQDYESSEDVDEEECTCTKAAKPYEASSSVQEVTAVVSG